MVPATHRPRKTVEDYLALPDDVRAELIGGDLYVTPSPTYDHQRVVVRLLRLLSAHVEAHELGQILVSPLDVHLPSGDVVQPDLIYVAKANREICRDWIRGVPDLLVEILSPKHAERDRIVKRDLYEANGVSEYWIVDPEVTAVEILGLEGARFRAAGWFPRGSTIVSPSLPGLTLRVDDVFPA